MKLETVALLGPSQESRSMRVNPQRSINMFAATERPGAKSPIVMYPTPGLSLIGTPTTGPTRSNGVNWNGSEYFVVGSSLVKIATGDVATVYTGFLTSGSGRCVIARGRDYLMIVDGTYGYSFNGTAITQITDAQFPTNPTHCAYLDGYFITNSSGTDDYYISDQEDPTAWASLDTSRALGSSDDITALATTNKDLYLFGPSTVEVHYNSQNPDFPFEVYPGGIIDTGIIAPHSLARSGLNGLVFLAGDDQGDAVIARISGFQVEPISEPDLNFQINELDTISDAFSMVHRRHGRNWYTITFPTADKTFEIDVDGKTWHERKSDGIGRWRGAGIGYLHPAFYIGDYDTGQIYKFSDDVYTENSETIERERYTQVTHSNGRRFNTHRLWVEVEPGVGLVTGQGSDPQLMMRFSDDGGKTWSSELWKSIGEIGEYGTGVTFDSLGQSRGRIYHFKLTDPVKFVIVSAYAEIQVLD
jgi:hypothetical protein